MNLTILPDEYKASYDEYVAAIVGEGIRVVETSGVLQRDVMEELQRNDIKVIHKCSRLSDARSAEEMGADAVSLDGFEASGFMITFEQYQADGIIRQVTLASTILTIGFYKH